MGSSYASASPLRQHAHVMVCPSPLCVSYTQYTTHRVEVKQSNYSRVQTAEAYGDKVIFTFNLNVGTRET